MRATLFNLLTTFLTHSLLLFTLSHSKIDITPSTINIVLFELHVTTQKFFLQVANNGENHFWILGACTFFSKWSPYNGQRPMRQFQEQKVEIKKFTFLVGKI